MLVKKSGYTKVSNCLRIMINLTITTNNIVNFGFYSMIKMV